MTADRPSEKVRCRPIAADDIARISALLHEGFPARAPGSFEAGLRNMANRPVPEGAQRFGYCLDTGSRIVGVVLLIASERQMNGAPAVFCNVSSWFVMPEYRTYAQPLISIALRNKHFTYTNVSPAPHTWDTIRHQGYNGYCGGLFVACAGLKAPVRGVALEDFDAVRHAGIADFTLLARQQAYGCHVVVARENGTARGFAFRPAKMKSGRVPLPAMFVIHAPSQADLVRLAGNFGRKFLRHGMPCLILDANGPVAGLRGFFSSSRGRKFYKGPHAPALCGLADSEFALFGL